MKLSDVEVSSLLVELERLDERVRARIRELKSDLGLKGKFSPKIHEGRIIRGEIQSSIREIREGCLERALDRIWALTQKGLKIKSIQFPADHKTFSQLQKESIRKNPEQLIKRSKSHGGGYRS